MTELSKQFIKQYHTSMTARQIADSIGVSRQAVQSYGDRNGFSFKPSNPNIKKELVEETGEYFNEKANSTWLI